MLSLSSAQAQTEQRLTMDGCVEWAMTHNATVRGSHIKVEQARQLQQTAYDIEPTEISLSQDLTGGGSPENALKFAQTFNMPSYYTSRHSLLKAQTQVERSRMEVTRNELRRNVSSAYCQLLYTQERLRILQSQDSMYAAFRRVAEAKYNAGETGRLELMNAEKLTRENSLKLQNMERDCQTARLALQQWMNTDDIIVPAENSLAALPYASADSIDFSTTPEGQLYESRLRESDKSVGVAKTGALPSVTLAASTQMVLKGLNPYDVDRSRFREGNFMGFEVGVNVPLGFWAQRARVKAAKKERELIETEREEQQRTLSSQYASAVNEWRKAQATIGYYTADALHQAQEMERISRVAYENGSIGYMELMQNIETATDMRLGYADAVNDYNQAVVQLRYLEGK